MLKGTAVSGGIAIGKAFVLKECGLTYPTSKDHEPNEEWLRFETATKKFTLQTEMLAKNLDKDEAQILKGHILMLNDPYMQGEIKKHLEDGSCIEAALAEVCDNFKKDLAKTDDELTKQRVSDVNDLERRMLKILLGKKDFDLNTLPPNTIFVVRELTPSMTAEINKKNVVGFLTEKGGYTSHAAIISRTLEIPAILGIDNITDSIKNNDTLILDGLNGEVILYPTEAQLKTYRQKKSEYLAQQKSLRTYIGKKTTIKGGRTVSLVCNIGNPQDADRVLECDGEGVGLFRTEFLFINSNKAPSEDEQFEIYRKTATKLRGKPVIIRTLDIGGDKSIPYLNIKHEENPSLGCRAIRYCLGHPDIFDTQLRALLRAGAYGDIRIMLPLITCIDELRTVKSRIAVLERELKNENKPYKKNIPLGVMIETPAAAIMADALAREADFFSIGANDLTQYTMAADRGSADVAYLCSVFSPAVLRSIRHIIDCAKNALIPVGMCGEAASDPRMIPLLIAFGLDEFSVSPTNVLSVRETITKWTQPQAETYAQKIMSLTTLGEVLANLA